jgi:hypothetical protein
MDIDKDVADLLGLRIGYVRIKNYAERHRYTFERIRDHLLAGGSPDAQFIGDDNYEIRNRLQWARKRDDYFTEEEWAELQHLGVLRYNRGPLRFMWEMEQWLSIPGNKPEDIDGSTTTTTGYRLGNKLCQLRKGTYEPFSLTDEQWATLAEWRVARVAAPREFPMPTHCTKGHELTPDNVGRRSDNGRWTCRKCSVIATQTSYRKRNPVKPPKPPRTHCVKGHEMTPENSKPRSDQSGKFVCRRCAIDATIASNAKRKARGVPR